MKKALIDIWVEYMGEFMGAILFLVSSPILLIGFFIKVTREWY